MTSNQNGKVALIDLDSLLHIVANAQWKEGNRDQTEQVKEHIRRFYAQIRKSADCQYSISFYQKAGHDNFRKKIWSRYKDNRVPSEAIIKWKSTILETFDELGAYGLTYVESDDIIAALTPIVGATRAVIVSSDKDMYQVVGEHYNPFKKGPADADDRWVHVNMFYANRFFWEQVLAGDGTDMPIGKDGAGIEGVGPATASKMTDCDDTFGVIIAREYTKKYGEVEGFKRAQLTYQMVRLLTGTEDDFYAGVDALEEIRQVKQVFKEYIVEVSNDVAALFGIKPTKGSDLFNN